MTRAEPLPQQPRGSPGRRSRIRCARGRSRPARSVVPASMNLVMPPGEKNRSGDDGRVRRTCRRWSTGSARDSPGMLWSWLSTACELWVGSASGFVEELLAAHDRDPRMLAQPVGDGRVGRDVDVADPRREHVDAAQGVLEFVDLPVARLVVVAVAHDVGGHPRGALRAGTRRSSRPPRRRRCRCRRRRRSRAGRTCAGGSATGVRRVRLSASTASPRGMRVRISAFGRGATISSSPKRQNSSCMAVSAPYRRRPMGSSRGR